MRNLDVIRSAIRDTLLDAGIKEFPSIHMATRSELQEVGLEV